MLRSNICARSANPDPVAKRCIQRSQAEHLVHYKLNGYWGIDWEN